MGRWKEKDGCLVPQETLSSFRKKGAGAVGSAREREKKRRKERGKLATAKSIRRPSKRAEGGKQKSASTKRAL